MEKPYVGQKVTKEGKEVTILEISGSFGIKKLGYFGPTKFKTFGGAFYTKPYWRVLTDDGLLVIE